MSRVDDMPGYLAALLSTAVMAVTAFFMDVAPLTQTDAAICVTEWPSWISNHALMAVAGFLMLWIVSVTVTQLNRRFNVEEGTSALPSSFFLLSTAAVPGFLTGITPGVLMALATVLSALWIFGCIDRDRKAQPLFLAGTVMAFGSMVEYSFIPLAIAVGVAAGSLGMLSPRPVLGYLFGLLTPWILVLGSTLVAPETVSIPWIYELPMRFAYPQVIAAGVTALTAVLLMLRQAVTPSNRSSRSQSLNRALNIILFIMIVAMGVDFHNFTAYLPTAGLLTGFRIAGLMGDRSTTSAPTFLIGLLVLIYVILYFISI